MDGEAIRLSKHQDLGLSIPRDEMLTAEQVAKILHLTARRVKQLALRGDIPSHKFGLRVLFAPGDVEAVINASRRA